MNIGLVLSGGMAKGAYQVGALRAIAQFLPMDSLTHISCASVGVLNGFAFATNQLDRVEAMWYDLCSEGSRKIITQVLRSQLLQQDIQTLFENSDPLSSVFYCSLLDITNKNLIYRNLQPESRETLPLYLKASVAMPIYNRAVVIDGISYFDGAMVDNIPVSPLMEHELDYLICVYFDDTCYQFENAHFDNRIIKVAFPAKNMVRQSLIFRREGITDMIREGFDRTTGILSEVFAHGYEDLDAVYYAIKERGKHETHSLRITGDVLVTNLNKLTRRFAKRKIVF